MDNESAYIDEFLLVEDRTKETVYSFCKHDVTANTLKFQYIKKCIKEHPHKYSLYKQISKYQLS